MEIWKDDSQGAIPTYETSRHTHTHTHTRTHTHMHTRTHTHTHRNTCNSIDFARPVVRASCVGNVREKAGGGEVQKPGRHITVKVGQGEQT